MEKLHLNQSLKIVYPVLRKVVNPIFRRKKDGQGNEFYVQKIVTTFEHVQKAMQGLYARKIGVIFGRLKKYTLRPYSKKKLPTSIVQRRIKLLLKSSICYAPKT